MNSLDRRVLILGAKSAIGLALAHRYAQAGFHLQLAARNVLALEEDKTDLMIRYKVDVSLHEFDVLDMASHRVFYAALNARPTVAICVIGILGNQCDAENDFRKAKLILDTNLVGPASILEIIAADFSLQRSGFIIGISSVAGDRGRKSNYFYGAAKAGFSAYLSGLRNRLHSSAIPVLTVKPGFVYTQMTEHMRLPTALTATPERVAEDIYQAQQKEKSVIYTSWYWRYIMLIIRNIPEQIFKKLSL